MTTPSLHTLRVVVPTPVKGAPPAAGASPSAAVADMACSAASGPMVADTRRVKPHLLGK